MRVLRGRGVRRVVLLVSRVDDRGLLAAAEAGATGVLRRTEATAGNLAAALRSAAAGEGTLPRTCWAGSCGRSASSSARCCRPGA
jgi:DNA-binding NarL/FixJ family response regulator